jgi:hypothetical protein
MADHEKEVRSLTESDAVVTDEDGVVRVKMERLQKGGPLPPAPDDSEEA